MNDKMKDKIIGLIMDKEPMNQNQGLELAKVFPDIKKNILKMKPGPNPALRQFFLDAVKTETDPDVLHNLGVRDIPRRIRYAVIDNPNTERRTIEQMARQSGNDAVARRAQNFLSKDPMVEASTLRRVIRKLIKENFML